MLEKLTVKILDKILIIACDKEKSLKQQSEEIYNSLKKYSKLFYNWELGRVENMVVELYRNEPDATLTVEKNPFYEIARKIAEVQYEEFINDLGEKALTPEEENENTEEENMDQDGAEDEEEEEEPFTGFTLEDFIKGTREFAKQIKESQIKVDISEEEPKKDKACNCILCSIRREDEGKMDKILEDVMTDIITTITDKRKDDLVKKFWVPNAIFWVDPGEKGGDKTVYAMFQELGKGKIKLFQWGARAGKKTFWEKILNK